MMKDFVLLLVLILFQFISAQTAKTSIDSLIDQQFLHNSFETRVLIEVAVPGIDMPNKEIEIKAQAGKKPKIKGKGLLLVPKKGLYGQLSELVKNPYQVIPMTLYKDSVQVKLVSLDPTSDWITADVNYTKSNFLIHRLVLNTKENGQFDIRNFYRTSGIPNYTLINFEVWNKKLPIKFLGRQVSKQKLSKDGTTKGSVKLTYLDFTMVNTAE